ncbi:MAG: TIGR04551 family protein [Myxococcales bacterium]|nr:TIGR04551 family protein [Myxococcales bacterium]
MSRPSVWALALAIVHCNMAALAQTPGPRGSEDSALVREPARDAPGVTPIDEGLRATANTPDSRVRIEGFLRTRGDLANNWSLGVGPGPSRVALWPMPYTAPGATQTNLDMRLRLDTHVDVGYGVSFHGRLHALDNLRWGSTPDGEFAGGSINQRGPADPIAVRQLYGQVLLPFGVLSAGRMGALVDWGTGFYVNAGNGLDDDFGDVGDRLTLTVPLAGLLWTAMYELSASGPSVQALRPELAPGFDIDPNDDVRTVALAVSRYDLPITRRRRLTAMRTTFNFGAVASYRWQDYDIAAGASPLPRTALTRDLTAFTADLWARLDVGHFTLEAELAWAQFNIGNASLDPAARVDIALTGRQLGGVVRADWRQSQRFFARLEAGFASGDDRPGFGARPTATGAAQPGDVDGPQFDLTRTPRDTNVDNFRFNPNYRVDLILFRRLIGTVTDAVYFRPMARVRLGSMFSLEGAVIGSAAMAANSTPSGAAPLGIETNVGLIYEQEHGFVTRLDYGMLVPLSGFRDVARGVDPSLAHALHLVMAFRL